MVMRTPLPSARKRAPRLVVVDTDSGQIFDANVRPQKRGGSTITAMYGPNWAATPLPAFRRLADDRELTGDMLRVMLFLLSKLEIGNHVRLRAVDVANEMGMDRHNTARILRVLRAKSMIVDRKPFGWQVSPNYGWRGDPTGLVGKKRDGSLVLLSNDC
jgi:hypothetical protein